jgi:hypothetical protein
MALHKRFKRSTLGLLLMLALWGCMFIIAGAVFASPPDPRQSTYIPACMVKCIDTGNGPDNGSSEPVNGRKDR